jgi:LPXTG-motif cell wall-anchored protein
MDLSFLKAEKPSGEEVNVEDVFVVEGAPESATETTPAAELPAELPKTGSALPLIGLIGSLSLGTAAALRLARMK